MRFIVSTSLATSFFLGYWSDNIMSDDERKFIFMQSDNRVSDNIEAICYFFNSKMRLASIRGTRALWKRSPQSLEKLQQLLDDNEFMRNVEAAKDQPNSPVARAVRKILMPLLVAAGRNVPFASAGSASVAFNRLIANARYYGLSAWFLTINPALHELLFPMRLALPHLSNAVSDAELSGASFVPPDSNDDRRKIHDEHPIGAALGFQILKEAIFKDLIGLPLPEAGSRFNNLPPKPPLFGPSVSDIPESFSSSRSHADALWDEHGYRIRGVLGEVLSVIMADESSAAGMSHVHSMVFPALNWNFIRQFAEFPEFNKKIGEYLDSIVWNSDPCNLPGWEELENEHLEYTNLPGLRREDAPTPLFTETAYRDRKLFMRKYKQNHFFHSFTCWKNMNSKNNPDVCRCRLHRPKHSWNQETSICQIFLLDSLRFVPTNDPKEPFKEVNVYDVTVSTRVRERPNVFELPFEDSIARSDNRILTPIFSCPSFNADIRDIAELSRYDTTIKPDSDPLSSNQWFVETNEPIAVTTLAQSNLQFITDDGQGSFIYRYYSDPIHISHYFLILIVLISLFLIDILFLFIYFILFYFIF
jgi:hypothetical protein